MRSALVASLSCLACIACEDSIVIEPAPGQVVLHFDTDAPVPTPTGAVTVDEAGPLFDRMRVEVFEPGRDQPCAGCTNDFALDTALFAERRASIGIAPKPNVAGYRVRVRIYNAAFVTREGNALPEATIESTIALPVVDVHGRIDASVTLFVDAVGVPNGSLTEPVNPELGPIAASLVGTWAGAARVPCESAPRPGEVCVPGGAFWMGETSTPTSIIPLHGGHHPKLVIISPFFLDATEVTVRSFRESKLRSIPWSKSDTGESILDFCNTSPEEGPRDDHPANCVAWREARAYCVQKKKDLPTESQYEYVAGGTRGARYVWGQDSPQCNEAMFSRLGHGVFARSTAICRTPTPPGGSAPVGTATRDRLELPTGTIVDLAGNVAEWTIDYWNEDDQGCWAKRGVYIDPVCRSPSKEDSTLRTVRGGSWLVTSGQLVRTQRVGAAGSPVYSSPDLGFRCARPGR